MERRACLLFPRLYRLVLIDQFWVETYLNQLNKSQREAVEYCSGPSLVVAGAGSGKTRVLTYKIAYLLSQGLPPYSILALTFTNKAAREMKERIAAITGEETARRLWMGTFHSIFSRILRSEATLLGYPSHFTIYDSTDSKNLIKAIIKEMKLDDKVYRPGMIQNRISNAKNSLITWNAYGQNKELMENDIKSKVPYLREIYKQYQNRSFQAGAMDFDDLLMQTNILFRDFPEVLDKYGRLFRYILVDEYQDTNFAQHLIIQKLSALHHRICVVGDDAQSIYSFRGANIDNMLQFQENYPGCRIFKLERNYRSTQNIVNAANSLILKNKAQIYKSVYSENDKGTKVKVCGTYSDYEEGYIVASQINNLKRSNRQYGYADFAILYRTNAQSRILEEALRKQNIPYRIYGGLSFYQRKEIKDIISYFRLIINPNDEEAFKRVINYPARGIGETTVQKLVTAAREQNLSLWTVLQEPITYGISINGGTARKLADFRQLIDNLIGENEQFSAEEIAREVVQRSGIASLLYQDRSVEGISRQENMEELLKGIAEFCEIRREEGMEQVSLTDFLSEVALATDQDTDKEEQADKITLMTVHAAKGLEFSNVFVVGLEENLFPSQMVLDNPRGVEEERRLFYVAITRARENCILTYAKSRFRNGQTNFSSPSRFIADIDPVYLELPEDAFPAEDRLDKEPGPFQSRPAFASPLQQPKPELRTGVTSQPRATTIPTRRLSRVEKDNDSPAAAPAANVPRLKAGMQVRHDRFGVGKVTEVEGNEKATVVFDSFGEKNLLLKYAKLKIIKET